jgi:hypothetical protein
MTKYVYIIENNGRVLYKTHNRAEALHKFNALAKEMRGRWKGDFITSPSMLPDDPDNFQIDGFCIDHGGPLSCYQLSRVNTLYFPY